MFISENKSCLNKKFPVSIILLLFHSKLFEFLISENFLMNNEGITEWKNSKTFEVTLNFVKKLPCLQNVSNNILYIFIRLEFKQKEISKKT